MDPATMMVVATAFKAAGSVVSGYSEAAGYEAQAGAANANARLATQNAQSASAQADLREEAVRRESRQLAGAQRAAVAESGTGYGGSNLDILRQDSVLAELDALNTRYEGAIQRTGFENEAKSMRYQASALKKAAGRAKINAWMSAGAQALQGFGNYTSAGGGGGGSAPSGHSSVSAGGL